MNKNADESIKDLHERIMCLYYLNLTIDNLVKNQVEPHMMADIGIVFRGLLDNFTFSTLIKDPEYENTVAWLCLSRVELASQGYGHPEKNNVGDMLKILVGTDVDEKHWMTQEALVNFLYGAATWGLYRNDVDEDALFPGYLWELKLPLKGPGMLGLSIDPVVADMALPGDVL